MRLARAVASDGSCRSHLDVSTSDICVDFELLTAAVADVLRDDRCCGIEVEDDLRDDALDRLVCRRV